MIVVASASHLPEANAAAGEYASRAIFGDDSGFGPYYSVSKWRDGKIFGAFIFHDWRPLYDTIQLSGAGKPGWLTRRLIRTAFNTAFDSMGAQMVTSHCMASDAATVSYLRRLGFTGNLIPRLGGKDRDMWLFTLTDGDWQRRWEVRH